MPDDAGQVRINHMRSVALTAAVLGVVVLPIAAAEATPVAHTQSSAQASSSPTAQEPSLIAQALGGQYCGSSQTSTVTGGSVTVQACVEQGSGLATAVAYVDNSSSVAQLVALNLVRQDGTTVSVRCTVAPGDSGASCTTGPAEIGTGTGAYDAVAELVGVGEPVSAGVVHVESGLVAPLAGAPAASSSAPASGLLGSVPTASPSGGAAQ